MTSRRSALRAILASCVAPAFIPASRLWLPPERPLVHVPPFPEFIQMDSEIRAMVSMSDGLYVLTQTALYRVDAWTEPNIIGYVDRGMGQIQVRRAT
jgi:hypothetical protein